ncbi:MAG: CpsD/CapB family tyrosine-protein kinase [Acutalibacteraceae bacterium]|nr:CpsD/CapB family tyrosine-protein kinase [Acutalibacteraceae bacterium]
MSLTKRKNKPVVKELFSVLDKNAPQNYVAAYKMLCTNIEFITVAQKCKNIMITSTIANEGKTNCSVNLSISLSQLGKKVCLVECDLRRPSVHRFVDSKRNTTGLTHVLKGEVEISKAIRKVSNTNMSILLAGMSPPNPTELLASERMQSVISELEKEYDYVIYDTPPAFMISDAAVLGRYMDATFMVVKHNSTEKKFAVKAKKNLENAGVKLFGVILTSYKDKANSSYSDYYSYNDYYYSNDEGKNNG